MKKILIALLAALLCLSLVACNNPADTTDGNDIDTTESTPDGPDNTKPEETTEPEITDTDTLAVGEDDGAGFGPINQ